MMVMIMVITNHADVQVKSNLHLSLPSTRQDDRGCYEKKGFCHSALTQNTAGVYVGVIRR